MVPYFQKLSLDFNSDHCIKPVVLKLLHRELGTAEYFLEVDGARGHVESQEMWLT